MKRGLYQTDQIKTSLNHIPEHFDLNCEYFQRINFDTDLDFLDKEFDARLWLRELMMSAQSNTVQFSTKSVLISSIILGLVPILLDMAFIKLDIDDDELPKNYWVYNVIIILFNTGFYLQNEIFLWVAFIDA